MELYYNLLGVYTPNLSDLELAKQKGEELIESSYIEDSDVIELAKETNSVFLVEVEQEDGYMEFIVVSNEGKLKHRQIYSPDKTYEAKDEIEKVGAEAFFTKKALKEIDELSKEYELTREAFIEECLDSYYYDIYEKQKDKYIGKMESYYKDELYILF